MCSGNMSYEKGDMQLVINSTQIVYDSAFKTLHTWISSSFTFAFTFADFADAAPLAGGGRGGGGAESAFGSGLSIRGEPVSSPSRGEKRPPLPSVLAEGGSGLLGGEGRISMSFSDPLSGLKCSSLVMWILRLSRNEGSTAVPDTGDPPAWLADLSDMLSKYLWPSRVPNQTRNHS